MNASRLQMMSKGSANFSSRTSPSTNCTESFIPSCCGALVGDGDHLFRQVDADHLGAICLRQVKCGSADAAADVEDANPRAQRRAQTGTEVIGRPGTAGADVAGAEDHLVSQDAGAAVLAMVVELGSGGRGRLRSSSCDLSARDSACSLADDLVPPRIRRRRAGLPILLESARAAR